MVAASGEETLPLLRPGLNSGVAVESSLLSTGAVWQPGEMAISFLRQAGEASAGAKRRDGIATIFGDGWLNSWRCAL